MIFSEKPFRSPLILLLEGAGSSQRLWEALGEPWASVALGEWGLCSPKLETETLEEERRQDLSDYLDRPDPGRSALEWVQELGVLNSLQKIGPESWAGTRLPTGA
jgi:hypothetical protein